MFCVEISVDLTEIQRIQRQSYIFWVEFSVDLTYLALKLSVDLTYLALNLA